MTHLGLRAVACELQQGANVFRDGASPFYVVEFGGHAQMIHEQLVTAKSGDAAALVALIAGALDACKRGESGVFAPATVDPVLTGCTRPQSIRLERVQFSKAVDLPCLDGARDSASALLGDGPAHELELDIATRIVTVRASAAMRARRGITSADRDFVIEVPLENVAYVRRMTDKTRDAIDEANERRKALLGVWW